MFGANIRTGKKWFEEQPESKGKLLVNEIFGPTLQGEGAEAGSPAYFIRLSKCNLACWFCDTEFTSGEWLSPEEILAKIQALHEKAGLKPIALFSHIAVITGGEPSLQNIAPLANLLDSKMKGVWAESNGILSLNEVSKLKVTVSPKAIGFRGKEKYAKLPKHIFSDNSNVKCLKYVLSAEKNSSYAEIPKEHLELANNYNIPVYVSPMAVYAKEYKHREGMPKRVSIWDNKVFNIQETARNYSYAAEYAVKHTLRLSVQQHLFCCMP